MILIVFSPGKMPHEIFRFIYSPPLPSFYIMCISMDLTRKTLKKVGKTEVNKATNKTRDDTTRHIDFW
jgi:hypothetical protein